VVIFYDMETKEIIRAEDNAMIPSLPANMTLEEMRICYKANNEDFISIPYELGINIYKFNLCFDENNNFIGIQAKEGSK